MTNVGVLQGGIPHHAVQDCWTSQGDCAALKRSLKPYVCPACISPLQCNRPNQHTCHLACAQCHEEFEVIDGVPCLIPSEAFRRFPINKIQEIYNRAYQHPGIMGTQLDPEYSRLTKTTLLNFCKEAPNSRILDIGTGDGDLWQFASSDCEWYGIDISEVGVRHAAQRFPALHGAVVASEWLPYPDHYFGAIIAADTIEHTFDIQQSLGAIKRTLAEGGVFALSIPTPNSLRKWGYNRLIRGGAQAVAMALQLVTVLLRRTILFGHPIFQVIDRDLPLDTWVSTLDNAGFKITACEEWPPAPLKPIVYLLAAKSVA